MRENVRGGAEAKEKLILPSRGSLSSRGHRVYRKKQNKTKQNKTIRE